MGSRQELLDATTFLSSHRIVPVVTHVLLGLEQAEEGFELIRQGNQFGKVVISIASPSAVPQQKL
jgi:D-arabinose 1-dehydrogenase-like Zn-dependent alcohol dehydrogenase